jgi:hypothetical protein
MLNNGLTSTEFFRKINANKIKKSNVLVDRLVQDDLNYGYTNENEILSLLNSTFSDTFRHTRELYGEYWNYDFEGNSGKKIEMKSRRNKHDTFAETIIPVHKCKNKNSPNIFIFQFTDGIYYIEYDSNKFDNDYEIKNIVSKRKDKYENKPHYFIPVSDLIKI